MNENQSTGVGLYSNWLNSLGNNSTTTATSDYTSDSGKGNFWSSLFPNLGGILIGAGGLVTAFKSDPNEIARAQSQTPIFIPGVGQRNVNNSTIWIVLAVLIVAAVLLFVFLKK